MTGPRRVQMTRHRPWRDEYPDAVIIDRRTKWGNPFRLGKWNALARVPAIERPDMAWEREGRISGDGMRHDYYHGDGRVTEVHVRYMTAAEVVECYRAYVTGGGWPLGDWAPRDAPTVEEIRAELAGRDIACWCPLEAPCHGDVLLEIANGGAS